MSQTIGSVFDGGLVVLDGNDFQHCTFRNAVLIFRASAPVALVSCTFENCRWEFEGAAAMTVQFMSGLYASGSGGRELIDRTIENIKAARTSPPNPKSK